MVIDTIMGKALPSRVNTSLMASGAALVLRVSNWVSRRRRSTPPSIRASICSEYAARSVSKSMARMAGFSTSGDIEAVLPVGPIDPATKRGLSGVVRFIASASWRAMRAAARFISRTKFSVWYSACEIACALKVQVVIISAPASRYWRCIEAISSGRVSVKRSLFPCSFVGCCSSILPLKSCSPRP